jgi:16S rRNA (adenine1518-N6/adenine1519-N6)-dimethyltransferase
VEIDRSLCRLLREELGKREEFCLIEGDALSCGKRGLNPALRQALEAGEVKLVANLPFGTATPLLVTVLEEIAGLDRAVVTVQWEVAERLAALPRQKAYGAVSVLAQVLARVEKVRRIDKDSFWPPPKVNAAVVRLTPRRAEERPPAPVYGVLRELVRLAFGQRRKTVGPRLAARWPAADLGAVIPAGARPGAVAPAAYLEAARRLAAGA